MHCGQRLGLVVRVRSENSKPQSRHWAGPITIRSPCASIDLLTCVRWDSTYRWEIPRARASSPASHGRTLSRHHLKFEINMHVLVVLVQSSSFHLDCSSPSIDPALRNAEQVDRTGSIMRRGFKGVDPVLACYPKLVAIDEEADHQLVHGRCCHLTHYG